MASTFFTKQAIQNRAMKSLGAGAPKPAITKVADHFPEEIALQNRRITGVTRKLLGGYQGSPARFVPKTKSLLVHLASGRARGK